MSLAPRRERRALRLVAFDDANARRTKFVLRVSQRHRIVTATKVVISDDKGYSGQYRFAFCDVSGGYHAVPSCHFIFVTANVERTLVEASVFLKEGVPACCRPGVLFCSHRVLSVLGFCAYSYQ